MANAYKDAAERVKLIEDEPIGDRAFQLVLINPTTVKYDGAHTTLKAILKDDAKDALLKAERVALRTQIIKDPGRAVDVGANILQFFAVNPNAESLADRTYAAILVEASNGEETALFYLNRDEVWELGHGQGFAVPLQTEPFAPAV